MKHIGFITYFYYTNYGTMLQSLALQRVLKSLAGEDSKVELIDCRFAEKKESLRELLLIRVKRFFIYFVQIKRIYRLLRYKEKIALRNPFFEQFVKSNILLSDNTYLFSQDIMSNPPSYDIYFTGSDQTWSPKIGFKDALFLEFAAEGKIRAAYAPSVGVASFSDDEKNYLREKLSKYDYISCREDYGAKILSEISGKEVTTVLDPTLLVTSEEWRTIAVKPKIDGKYILCYFLGDRKYYRNYVKQLSKQLKLPVYYIPVSYEDMTPNNNLLWETGPREFLGLIDNASVVCTDSFHGMAFCTNMGKTFYGFVKHQGKKAGDNSRIYDFLDRMGLRERLLEEYNGGRIEFKEIDFTNTNKRLKQERQTSREYLEKIIAN